MVSSYDTLIFILCDMQPTMFDSKNDKIQTIYILGKMFTLLIHFAEILIGHNIYFI